MAKDEVAERAARKIAENVRTKGGFHSSLYEAFEALMDECRGSDDALDEFTEAAAPLIATEYAPVMNVLREALAQSGHVRSCSYQNSHPWDIKNCNCWVSRAQKIVGEG